MLKSVVCYPLVYLYKIIQQLIRTLLPWGTQLFDFIAESITHSRAFLSGQLDSAALLLNYNYCNGINSLSNMITHYSTFFHMSKVTGDQVGHMRRFRDFDMPRIRNENVQDPDMIEDGNLYADYRPANIPTCSDNAVNIAAFDLYGN